jgi:hypothetical protein
MPSGLQWLHGTDEQVRGMVGSGDCVEQEAEKGTTMTITRKASTKGRIRMAGLIPHALYTVTLEPVTDLPKDARLVTDAERGWAEKPEGLRHRNRNTDRYWYPTAKKVRERNEWNPEFEYAISKDTVLRPRAEEGRRHVTEEERRTKAKPDCARYWIPTPAKWVPVIKDARWKDHVNWYSIPADHVWAEAEAGETRQLGSIDRDESGRLRVKLNTQWKDADDETRRLYEMPEGAERWDEGRGWCPCRGYMWDSGGVSIRYPASAQLTPRPKDGCHPARPDELECLPEGSFWWNGTPKKWRPFGVGVHVGVSVPICCPDAPVVKSRCFRVRYLDGRFDDELSVVEYRPDGSAVYRKQDGSLAGTYPHTLGEMEGFVADGAWEEGSGPTKPVVTPWERDDVPFHPGEAYLVEPNGTERLVVRIDNIGITTVFDSRWAWDYLLTNKWQWAKCNSGDELKPCGKEAHNA